MGAICLVSSHVTLYFAGYILASYRVDTSTSTAIYLFANLLYGIAIGSTNYTSIKTPDIWLIVWIIGCAFSYLCFQNTTLAVSQLLMMEAAAPFISMAIIGSKKEIPAIIARSSVGLMFFLAAAILSDFTFSILMPFILMSFIISQIGAKRSHSSPTNACFWSGVICAAVAIFFPREELSISHYIPTIALSLLIFSTQWLFMRSLKFLSKKEIALWMPTSVPIALLLDFCISKLRVPSATVFCVAFGMVLLIFFELYSKSDKSHITPHAT